MLDKSTIYVRWAQGDIRNFLAELYPSIPTNILKIDLEYNKEIRDYDVQVLLDGKLVTVVNDMIEANVPENVEWRDVWDETLLNEKRRVFDELKAVV